MRIIVAALLVLYITSYLAISRHGMAIARREGPSDCFYYVQPPMQASPLWFFQTIGLILFYWPANALDQAIGTGMQPISSARYLSAMEGQFRHASSWT